MVSMKVTLLFVVTIVLTSKRVTGKGEDLRFLYANRSCAPPIRCPYVPKDQVLPQSKECCRNLTQAFHCSWLFNGVYLTRVLQTLKSWNCTEEFRNQCENRYSGFTTFTDNIYLSFCDHAELERKCLPKIASLIDQEHTEAWDAAILKLDMDDLSKEEVLDTCVQAAVYEADRDDDYVEITKFARLYCDLAWAGFDGPSLLRLKISLWDIFPSRCRIQTRIMAAILVILGIFGFLTNSAFITTIYRTPTLHHSQYVYKTSIALSDVIMTLLVFPSTLNIIYKYANEPFKLKEVSVPARNESNVTAYLDEDDVGIISQTYLDGFGAIYMVAFLVSVYTLLLATADRLYAISYPLRYRKSSSRKNSLNMCLAVWCISLIIAILPTLPISDRFKYELQCRTFVILGGGIGSIVMAALFAIPLPLMWVMIALTFIQITRGGKRSSKLHVASGNSRKQNKQEIHLAVTLFLMVSTFTLSILPAAIRLAFFRYRTLDFIYVTKFTDNTSYHSTALTIEWVAFILFNCNTMWNFLIYNARNKQFRSALLKYVGDLLLVIRCTTVHKKIERRTLNKSTYASKTATKSSSSAMIESNHERAETHV